MAPRLSPDFISSVTDEVMAETLAWQSRPLEAMYPVVFFDALRVKIRDDGVVSNKAVYLALSIQADGQHDVLGLWTEQTEGAKFWLKVFNELKTRGCHDILIAVVNGLKGLPGAIGAAYPRTTVQTCIVHLIRNSLEFASYKDREGVAAALGPIYAAASEQAALQALQSFEGPWGTKYPTIVQSWQRAWEHVTPFFVFAPAIRRVVYTTNAIESLNLQLRKIIKTRGHFPNDEAAIKLLWPALRNVLAKSVRTAFDGNLR
jgi:transposase-like protein